MIGYWVLIGAVLGASLVGTARWRRRTEIDLLALGLFIAALIYVVFAAADWRPLWFLVEVAGLAIFGAFAVLARRNSSLWLTLGWGLHTLWDILLHGLVEGTEFVPRWYVWFCVGFDLVVALYVAFLWYSARPRTK